MNNDAALRNKSLMMVQALRADILLRDQRFCLKSDEKCHQWTFYKFNTKIVIVMKSFGSWNNLQSDLIFNICITRWNSGIISVKEACCCFFSLCLNKCSVSLWMYVMFYMLHCNSLCFYVLLSSCKRDPDLGKIIWSSLCRKLTVCSWSLQEDVGVFMSPVVVTASKY